MAYTRSPGSSHQGGHLIQYIYNLLLLNVKNILLAGYAFPGICYSKGQCNGQTAGLAVMLPIRVERWRAKHESIESAAWIDILRRLADDRAGAVEIDRKRALRRRDLIKALAGF